MTEPSAHNDVSPDIVERLRANNPSMPTKDRFEAADEIERLRLEHQHACQEIAVAIAERDHARSVAQASTDIVDADDIVDRLRDHGLFSKDERMKLFIEAADEINDLRILVGNMNKDWNGALLEIERLRGVAQPQPMSPDIVDTSLDDPDFVMSEDVQTDYERGRMAGIAHMRSMADDVLQRSLADELEIEALKARIEDLRRRLTGVAQQPEDWSCVADFLDDIEVDDNGMCRWADVANAQTHIRHTMRAVHRASSLPSTSSEPAQASLHEAATELIAEVDRTADSFEWLESIAKIKRALSSLPSTHCQPEEITKAEMDAIEDAAIAGTPLSSTQRQRCAECDCGDGVCTWISSSMPSTHRERVNMSGTDLLPMDEVREIAASLPSTHRNTDAAPANRSTAKATAIVGDDRESMETQPTKVASPEAGSPSVSRPTLGGEAQ